MNLSGKNRYLNFVEMQSRNASLNILAGIDSDPMLHLFRM